MWRLRPWSSTIAMPKCSWMSGTSRSGRVFRKPPHSAKFEVIGPRRSRRYWRDRPQAAAACRSSESAGEVRIVRHVAEDEIRMVLQVLPDAGQMMHARDAVLAKRGAIADARQHQQLRRLERAGGDDHLAPRADLLGLLALPVFDADRALALEQDAGGVRAGLDAQIGAACRCADACRRAPRSSARRSVCVTW